ncbi:unnamed protein product [Rangifer tarandus platyrhynchus]|uniref:Uncharacterized protein n=1 Tax=Rangifer tarandus platyrhynchus TaxID=3082113 RepID=A0ABN8ZFC5_RANTA|nr:unnamed protein product [Rangifer tarandus platyrhynchus]CAI9688917.1 unnamed protein product [Rangifer tarandus platyrhynchus]
MAGSALARSPSRWQVRLTPCLSRSLTAPLTLPPPPPSPAGSARCRRRRRRRRQVVAARRRRVTRRSVRDSGRRQRALPATHHLPPPSSRGSRPPPSRPSVSVAAAAAAERVPSALPLARARALPAVGASTAHGPGLKARLRRGLPAAFLPALLPATVCSAPGRTSRLLGSEGGSQAQAGTEPCRACVSSQLRALSVVVSVATTLSPAPPPPPNSPPFRLHLLGGDRPFISREGLTLAFRRQPRGAGRAGLAERRKGLDQVQALAPGIFDRKRGVAAQPPTQCR